MLKNYFRIALRNLARNKLFSLINFTGLSIGIAAFILIFQYVSFELSYDKSYENAGDIYRVTYAYYENNELIFHTALNVPAAGPALKKDYGEILKFTRLLPYSRNQFVCLMRYGNGEDIKTFNEENLFFVDSSIFSFFSLELIRGDPVTALQDPYSVVITSSTAIRYFGNKNPIGEILTLNSSGIERQDFRVTGVLKDFPENSHIRADILLPLDFLYHAEHFGEEYLNSWVEWSLYTYVLVSPEANVENLNARLPDFIDKHLGEIFRNNQKKANFYLQPVRNIHLHSNLSDEIKPVGNAGSVNILSIIAFFILIIAWFNYINLETTRSLERSKGFGVRIISGASRPQLIYQFLVETFIIHLFSIFFAMFVVYFSISFFQHVSGVPFNISAGRLLFILALFLLSILISGTLPAFLIMNIKPAEVLKGEVPDSRKGLILRKGLITIQFAISAGLLTGVFIIYLQFNFMQKQKLGIDTRETIIIKAPNQTYENYTSQLKRFKTDLQNLAAVSHITTSSIVPGKENSWLGSVRKVSDNKDFGKNMAFYVIDTAFINAYNLKILVGRNFFITEQPGRRFGDKLEPVILNQEAFRQLGYAYLGEAIGEIIYWENIRCKIIGIVNNFHQQSVKYALQPAIFTLNNRDIVYFSVKLHSSQATVKKYPESMAFIVSLIQTHWKKSFPEDPFDYFFLDDFFNLQYQSDLRIRSFFNLFSAIALIISCMGLFGLSSYLSLRRTKEIGIRKILGAPLSNIIYILTGEFIILVLLSCLIGIPLAYFIAQHWLENYAYRVEIPLWITLLLVLLVYFLAFITVSAQTIKTALVNPVKSIRQE